MGKPRPSPTTAGLIVFGAAIVTTVLGLTVLASWHIGNARLIYALPGLTPMSYNSGVAFALCGLALLALAAGARAPALGAAGLVATLGLLTLLEHFFGLRFGIDRIDELFLAQEDLQTPYSGRIPANAAICFFQAGATIALLGARPGLRRGSLIGALSGSVVLALGAVAFVGYLAGLPTYGWWPVMTRMAVHGSVGFTVVGLGVIALAWRQERVIEGSAPRWLPLPVGLGALTATLCLWQAMVAVEQAHLDRLARLSGLSWERASRELSPLPAAVVPYAVLVTGLALAGLLTLAVHLALTAQRRARAAEAVQAELRRSEEALRRAHDELEARVRQRTAELERAGEEMREREEMFRRLFEDSPFGTAIVGLDYKYIRVNRALCEMLGYREDELAGMALEEVTHPDDRQSDLWLAERLLRGEIPGFKIEKRYLRKDGEALWTQLTRTLIRKPDGAPLHMLGMIENISGRKRREQEIRRLNQELEQRVNELTELNRELESFTYSVSHDLRAPLRHVDGFSRILLEEAGGRLDAADRRCLQRILEGAQQMGRMVDDLLGLSRMGRREPSRRPTDLRAVVEEVLADLKPEMEGRQVALQVGELPTANCDPALIKQVFANLLSNALKFTRPRARAVIEIGQEQDGSQRAVFVRDNGVGFSMKCADKLFGVFQRLHREEDFEGNGVGLATVQRIIQKHGGRVWAEAEPDRGATFYFTVGNHRPAEHQPQLTATTGQ